jgi:hypothetical protein
VAVERTGARPQRPCRPGQGVSCWGLWRRRQPHCRRRSKDPLHVLVLLVLVLVLLVLLLVQLLR